MADDQAPDALWHFERTHRFGGPERVGLSDGGTTPAGDRYLDLSVWNDAPQSRGPMTPVMATATAAARASQSCQRTQPTSR